MKKTLLVSALFLFISIFVPNRVLAQCNPTTGVNCFQCTWTGIECVVDIATYNCQPGFDSDRQVCSSQTNMSDCQGQINNDCVSTAPPEERCFECVDTITGCIPRDVGDPRCEYSDFNTCDAACRGQPARYRCEDRVCIEDPEGPYQGYVDCEARCTEGKFPIEGPDPSCGASGEKGIDTAIGCIPVEDTDAFIGFILRWAIGIGGGIAFLLIIFAGFQIMTSAGNPERLQGGRELLTSAIAGLILLVFSVFILRIIGVDILKLPGLN